MPVLKYKGFEIEKHGKVNDYLIKIAAKSIDEVFNLMHYGGEKPRIEVGSGYVIFAGKKIPSLYEKENPVIKLGIKGIVKNKKRSLPLEIAVVAYAAHEAAHHVQNILNYEGFEKINVKDLKEYEKIKDDALEIIANQIAGIIVKNLYGKNISFTDKKKIKKKRREKIKEDIILD